MATSKSRKQKEEKIESLNNKALEYFDKKKWNESAKIFRQILDIDPNNLGALVTGGGALSNAGKYKEALKFLNKALKIDQNDISALENKGITLSKLRDKKSKKAALKCFDKALEINPNRKNTISNKIDTLYEFGEYNEQLYKKALKLRIISKFDYYHDKGVELERKENFGETIKLFKKALKLSPQNFHIINHLAFDYFDIENYSRSINYVDKLLKSNPKDIDVLVLKTKAMIKLKKYEEA